MRVCECLCWAWSTFTVSSVLTACTRSRMTICRYKQANCRYKLNDKQQPTQQASKVPGMGRRPGGIGPLTLSGPTDLKSAPRTTWAQVGLNMHVMFVEKHSQHNPHHRHATTTTAAQTQDPPKPLKWPTPKKCALTLGVGPIQPTHSFDTNGKNTIAFTQKAIAFDSLRQQEDWQTPLDQFRDQYEERHSI